MANKPSAYNEGVNLIGDFVVDCSNFKVVPHARDPKSFPSIRDITPEGTRKKAKKPKKKKDK